MTRDSIQGFVDGYIKAGGDITQIQKDITDWMDKHPVYPQSKEVQAVVMSDLESYRGIVQPKPIEIQPAPIEEAPPL